MEGIKAPQKKLWQLDIVIYAQLIVYVLLAVVEIWQFSFPASF